MSQPNQNNHNFRDTKIFVGGLPWKTTTEGLRSFFEQHYGEVIDANVVSEGLPGNLRSKGYGFVVFRNAESANTACELPWPVIDGRQTNVNMAYIGAKINIDQANQNGVLHQAGPSHQYQNGLVNQAAPHQFQLPSHYPHGPYPYTPSPTWVPYYNGQYMYNVPCHSYSTSPMYQFVLEYRRQRNNQPSVKISPPREKINNEKNEEEADAKINSDQGEMNEEDKDISQNVKTSKEKGNGHEENGGQEEVEEEQEYIQDQIREAT